MKVRIKGNLIRLRGETKEEKAVLAEMWNHGVVAFAGGGELGICSKKFFGSGPLPSSEMDEDWKYFCTECGDMLETSKEMRIHYINEHSYSPVDATLVTRTSYAKVPSSEVNPE